MGLIEGDSDDMYSSTNARNVLIYPDDTSYKANMYYIGSGKSVSSLNKLTDSLADMENDWGIDVLAMEDSSEKVSITFTID